MAIHVALNNVTHYQYDRLVKLGQMVQQDVGYTIRLEPGVQTPEETLTKH